MAKQTTKRSSDAEGALTTNHGTPISDNQSSLHANPRGPTLLEDFILREKITHFDHERIPERIVHARGSAAHGYFELTHSLSKYTTAKVLTEVGVRTPLFTRFSTVAGGSGSVDTPRDVRGFAVVRCTRKKAILGSRGQQHSRLLHSGRHQVSRYRPRRKDGTRSRLSSVRYSARHVLGLHWSHAGVDAHADVDHERPHHPALAAHDGGFRYPLVPPGERQGRLDVREIPLAPQARAAIDRVGRGREDRWCRSGFSPSRPLRRDHLGRLSRVGARRAAVHRCPGSEVPV